MSEILDEKPKKIYPSRMPGVIHPCTAKGMKRIEFWIDPERKARVKQYCKMKKVTMSDFFIRAGFKEINQNIDKLLAHLAWERRHIRRAKAYRYLLGRLVRKRPQEALYEQPG